jgi:hypothetical protein
MFKRTGKPPGKSQHASTLDFALRFKMITPDEHRACLAGEMEIRSRQLFKKSASGTWSHISDKPDIYQGRADQIMIDQLLGIEEPRS